MRIQHLLLILLVISCDQKTNLVYHGMVIDERNRPIENVKIFEAYSMENMTKTNRKGYFKINMASNKLAKLVFVKHGYKTDTIPSVWSQHGERVAYNFIENDTTIVRLKTKIKLNLLDTKSN